MVCSYPGVNFYLLSTLITLTAEITLTTQITLNTLTTQGDPLRTIQWHFMDSISSVVFTIYLLVFFNDFWLVHGDKMLGQE